MTGLHDVVIYFHFSEHCQDIGIKNGVCNLNLGDDKIAIALPEQCFAQLISGQVSDDKQTPSLGWLSRGYHQKVAITTLVLSAKVSKNNEFITSVSWD